MNGSRRAIRAGAGEGLPFWQRVGRGAAALGLAASLSLPALAGGIAVAQESSIGTQPAAIVPENALLYFGVDADLESSQWTLANELLARAGAESDPTTLVNDLTESATGQDAQSLAGEEALLGGEAAIVVATLNPAALEGAGVPSITDIIGGIDVPTTVDQAVPTSGGFALVIKPSDLAAATQFVADDLDSQAQDAGVSVDETTYKGATIRSIAGDPDTGDAGTAYAVVDDFIVIAETTDDIEPLIDTSAGDTAPLAELAEFKQADAALAGDRLGFGFINGSVATTDVATVASADSPGSFDFLSGLPTLGGYTGISVIADDPGFRLNTVGIPGDGVTFEAGGDAAGLGFADRVPADTLVFVNGYDIGQGALLQGLGLFLVSAFAQGFSGLDATPVPIADPNALYEQAAALIGFNLKTDLIDQMTGEYGFALWGVDLNDPSKISAVLTSGIDQPLVLADSLSKLSLLVQAAAQGQATVTTRTVNDSRINSVAIGQDPATTVTVEYGVVQEEFLLGVGGGVDGYLGIQGDALSANADYQAALAELPAEYDGIFYVNVADAVQLASEADSSFGMDSGTDASSACGEYGSQEAAQSAYDKDPVTNFDLDLDFDGQACEDYFVAAITASPVGPDANPYAAVRSFATVSFKQDGLAYTNSILMITAQ